LVFASTIALVASSSGYIVSDTGPFFGSTVLPFAHYNMQTFDLWFKFTFSAAQIPSGSTINSLLLQLTNCDNVACGVTGPWGSFSFHMYATANNWTGVFCFCVFIWVWI
jgi:hypothetical protein